MINKIQRFKDPDFSKNRDYRCSYMLALNPNENGGEAATLIIDCYHNGKCYYFDGRISLSCYGSHSSEITIGNFSLDLLRKIGSIADIIEKDAILELARKG